MITTIINTINCIRATSRLNRINTFKRKRDKILFEKEGRRSEIDLVKRMSDINHLYF